jgi:tetrapyrrole methylase family protein/MazG family protein
MLKKKYTFQDLLDIMRILRSEKGCPWDKEQTHESIKKYLIEETYEVIEAMETGDSMKFADELGDLLLQIIFHSQIASENKTFNIDDVIFMICNKMTKRHTHVFGKVIVDGSEEVLDNWDEIKREEKGLESHTQELRDVSSYLPALMHSYKVQQKAAKVGFDWDDVKDVMEKVREEIKEVEDVYNTEELGKIEEEIGDLLFAVVNLARFLKVDPEMALRKTVDKFINRFEYIEKSADSHNKRMEEMSLEEMDSLWNEAKRHSLQKKMKKSIE